jgi:hypothetical protein
MHSAQIQQAGSPKPQCRRSPDGVHHWQTFVLGRICIYCRLVQARDEFDDAASSDDGPERAEREQRGA